jgi:DNA modification methylase
MALLSGYQPPQRTVKAGQVWGLGPHRLMCGSSTNPRHLDRLFNGERASCLVTSPPYARMRHYANTFDGDFTGLMIGLFECLPDHMVPDHQCLINLGIKIEKGAVLSYHDKWLDWMINNNGYKLFNRYVWDKCTVGPADPSHLMRTFEDIYHFHRIKRMPNKTVRKKTRKIAEAYSGRRFVNGERKPKRIPAPNSQPDPLYRVADSIFRISRDFRPGIRGEHPAVFPVALPQSLMAIWSDPGDIVFEPFSGSGSSVLAANNIGRRALAMECVPKYVEIALSSWEAETGTKPVLLY